MKYNLIFGLMLSAVMAFAQDPEAMKKIEAARIALITERLNLTPEQAEKFWPVYREYTQQRQQLRDELKELKRTSENPQMNDEESKKVLERGHQLKERQLSLDKTYNDRLGSVITNNQILQLRRAEEDFRQMIIKRIEKRKDDRERIDRRGDRKLNDQ